MDFYGDISEVVRDSKSNRIKRIIQSVSISYIACVVAILYMQGLQAFFYAFNDINAEFGFARNDYMPDGTEVWRKSKIVLIYAFPPTILLFTGFLLYVFLWYNSTIVNRFRFFIVWLVFYLICIPCSHLILSPIGLEDYYSVFYFGYAVVGAWLNIPVIMMIGFTLAGLLISVVFGTILTREFLKFSYSSRAANNQRARLNWMIEMVLTPLILTTLILVAVANYDFEISLLLIYVSSGLFIFAGLILKSQMKAEMIRVKKGDILKSSPYYSLSLMIIVFMTVYLFFFN